ncbi:hypothetical protein NDU88_000984 [Pleurodeles waltl]|uniref:Uncharacterized protein n=1 Tax=Pleurodeles waltl TaxID=8319 RepID=A0AAV7S7A5_PLEWA|nr:hypothetical protein NDU88_000984 [Pleurodeles waltl]
MEEYDDGYTEEEEISYFPVTEDFCDTVDASVIKAVLDAVAPLEKKLMAMTHQCINPSHREKTFPGLRLLYLEPPSYSPRTWDKGLKTLG